jgi:hypothetical protein
MTKRWTFQFWWVAFVIALVWAGFGELTWWAPALVALSTVKFHFTARY